MTEWNEEDLSRIGKADELAISSLRHGGTLGRARTIWLVCHGNDLYLRSVNGRDSDWFRGIQQQRCHIAAGGVERDVDLLEIGDELQTELDAAYATKPASYAQSIIDHITGSVARGATLAVIPRS